MKKLIITLVAILALGLVGCSSTPEVKDVPVVDIKAALNTEALLPAQPVAEMDFKDYYVFDSVEDKIKEGFVLKAQMMVTLQDVCVVKANSSEDVEAIKTALEDFRSNDQGFKMFEGGYGSEDNAIAAADAILASKGDYVYFIATKNAKDIEAKILETLE